MKNKSVVGALINFRGLVYSPVNENGVIFVFGKVIEDLNMYIEEIKPGFPDCVGRRFTGRGWERVYIEFEYKSSNFVEHGHKSDQCDLIVCWEHDWPDCPLEVIELREVIKSLPSRPVQRPDVEKLPYSIEDLYERRKVVTSVKNLFQSFDREVKSIQDEIWSKVAKTTITYYSPERVFIYIYFRQRGITFDLFTRGEKIEGVKNYHDPTKGEARWGWIYLQNDEDLPKILDAVRMSYKLIKEAVKNNEPASWYAKIEEEENKEVIDEANN